MSVELLRIDDRLVHGQVVEGWLRSLRLNHIVVANDGVDSDETQKALYMLAVPHGVELTCYSVADAAAAWSRREWESSRALILVSNPQDVLRMAEAGAPVKSVNVGGIHFREGRIQLLKAVSLDEADVSTFKSLAARGILLEARALPLEEPVDLRSYLEKWQQLRESMTDQPR